MYNFLVCVKSGSNGKESACNAGDLGSIPGLVGGVHDNPVQCSCLENPHGQMSLAGYSPWGRNADSDTIKQLNTAQGCVTRDARNTYRKSKQLYLSFFLIQQTRLLLANNNLLNIYKIKR